MHTQCAIDHSHVELVGGRAGPACRYTEAFCNDIVKCVHTQLLHDRSENTAVVNGAMLLHDDGTDQLRHELIGEYVDDVSGGSLDPQTRP